MFTLRSEVSFFVRSCEYLISATSKQGNAQLSTEECEIVEYYAGKLLKLTAAPSPDAGLQLDILAVLSAHHDTATSQLPASWNSSPSDSGTSQ